MTEPTPRIAYKILRPEEWAAAQAAGVFTGTAVDLADGFIHLSTAAQVQETAARHFADEGELVLLMVDLQGLEEVLQWEPARNGALFPHLYTALDLSCVIRVDSIARSEAGHDFPHLQLGFG